MADSLDDFFAKKDKKRKDKSKSSAISAVSLVKELEEGSKQAEFNVRKEAKTSALEILGLDTNDADWKDFEDVEKRDYTGLKVKEMSIQDQEEDTRRQMEKAEQAPEPAPWRSKEATVAAITSAPNDPTLALEQQLLDQLAEPKEGTEAEVKENDSDTKGEPETAETKKEGEEKTSEIGSDSPKPKPEDTPTGTTADSTNTEGDTKKPETTSAKTKYVPPHERGGEAKILQPTRMKNLRGPGGGAYNRAHVGNLQDEKEYPSLG